MKTLATTLSEILYWFTQLDITVTRYLTSSGRGNINNGKREARNSKDIRYLKVLVLHDLEINQ